MMRGGQSNRIVGISGKSHAVRRYLARRVCAMDDCVTVLSIYNQAEFCSVHERPIRRTGSLVGP